MEELYRQSTSDGNSEEDKTKKSKTKVTKPDKEKTSLEGLMEIMQEAGDKGIDGEVHTSANFGVTDSDDDGEDEAAEADIFKPVVLPADLEEWRSPPEEWEDGEEGTRAQSTQTIHHVGEAQHHKASACKDDISGLLADERL